MGESGPQSEIPSPMTTYRPVRQCQCRANPGPVTVQRRHILEQSSCHRPFWRYYCGRRRHRHRRHGMQSVELSGQPDHLSGDGETIVAEGYG
jgi:hypothetical protein